MAPQVVGVPDRDSGDGTRFLTCTNGLALAVFAAKMTAMNSSEGQPEIVHTTLVFKEYTLSVH